MRGLVASIVLLLPASPALAHSPEQLVLHWVFWALLVSLAAYVAGWLRSRQRPPAWRPALFASGWVLVFIALAGPVEHWAEISLAGHMTQHMILLAIAPPLLLLARPMPQFMQALSPPWRRRVGPQLARVYGTTAATPILAFLAHGLVIWFWHLPTPYQLALDHWLIHDLEHLLFFGTGLWFWWSLIAPGRLGRRGFGLASVLAVLTLMHTGMLGALLTFAPQLLYPDHPAGFGGLDQLSDQQLAGLLMWVPGGLIYCIASLALTGLWLRRQEATVTARGADAEPWRAC